MSGSDRSPHGLEAHLAAQDWPRLRAEVLRFAVYVARSTRDAEDLVQEAIARSIDPDADPWDPEKQPRLAKHLMRIIDNIHRAERARREVRLDPRKAATVAERTTPRAATPEDAALASEENEGATRTLEAVKLALRDDPLALQLVELSESGVDRPQDQASATGKSVDEIRNARKRVRRAIDAALQSEQAIPPGPHRVRPEPKAVT